jgi:hypothetical protein
MAQKFAIAARSALSAGIGPTATSFSVTLSNADLFPIADTNSNAVGTVGKDWFKVVLEDANHNIEIVYVRTRALGSATFSNVLRGQEGTTARSYIAGSIVGLRHTSNDLADAISVASGISTFWKNLLGYTTGFFSRSALGATAVGEAIFTALTAADARTALEFNKSVFDLVYPVGSIYTNASNNTNPATLLGFGTWTAFGAGRVPVGFDSTNALFNTAGKTGGSADATLPSHTHTFTGSPLNPHTHQIGSRDATANDGGNPNQEFVNDFGTGGGAAATTSPVSGGTPAGTNSTEGVSATNANYQPYITVYMWRRTA